MASKIYAAVLTLIFVSVFAIRFQHAGPYAMPTWGPLVGAAGCLVIAGLLVWSVKPKWLTWLLLILSPIAAFPALYSIGGEAEEVISLFPVDQDGNEADLRLWVVDRDDGAWVGLGRNKAVAHNLDGSQLRMLRGGETRCVIPRLYEDRPTVEVVHGMKVDKYVIAQLSGAIGLYPLQATESTVALRLDRCD